MSNGRVTKKIISPRATKAKLSIEQVIGTTSRHNSCIAINPINGDIAYAVGCVVAISSPVGDSESYRYLSGPKPKSISCLAFSPNGKFLAVGESGYQPGVLVFDVSSNKLIVELSGHRCGVSCVQFDPSCKWLVSVGFHEDKLINVWDWKEKQIVAINKIANKIYNVDFGEDGTYFVTCGVKHLKLWYLTDTCGGPIKKTEKTYKGRAVLDGKMVALGEKHKDCNFMDVCCSKSGSKFIFAVTEDGFLIQVDQPLGRIEKWVNMKSSAAYGLSVTENYISVACTDGITRIFNPQNLQYVSTLPKPAATGYEISSNFESQTSRIYPDVVGIKFFREDTLFCLYSNRSIVIWDIQDFTKVGILHSFLSHSACIWDLVTLSNGSFVTSSADKTIKFWNLESKVHKTPFSKELVKSLAICDNYAELKMENVAGGESSFIGEEGIRCLAVSPDEKHLASGDRAGNLRVHDIDTFECVSTLPAHDTEILSLAYSCPFSDGTRFLASGSRDRLIHIFQRVDGYPDPYSLTTTLDDHTSTVTSVKFSEDKGVTKLISTSTDKSILFRKISIDSGEVSLSIYHREATGLPVYDIEIDPKETSFVGVGAETKISLWDITGGKKAKSIAVTDADSVKGKLLKVDIDPSGQFVVTSSQDRFIRLYELATGNMIAKVTGHSELITALKFTKDCSRVVTVSGDGCIFVWRLSNDLITIMQKKFTEIQDQIPRVCALANAKSQRLNRFSFDHTRLPIWAQRYFLGENSDMQSFSSTKTEPRYRGAWSYHVDSIPQIHSALLKITPKSNASTRTLKGCSTPGRSKKNPTKSEQFQIDNQTQLPRSSLILEPTTDDTDPNLIDDAFTSVSEDNPPDFLLKNYEDFSSTFLPGQPKNKNRLTLSHKHFDKITIPIDGTEEKENIIVASVNLSKNETSMQETNSQESEKKAKWDKEVEKSKQILKELGISLGDDVPSPVPISLFGTPKNNSFYDLTRKGTNMTPSKDTPITSPISRSLDKIPTSQKEITSPQVTQGTPSQKYESQKEVSSQDQITQQDELSQQEPTPDQEQTITQDTTTPENSIVIENHTQILHEGLNDETTEQIPESEVETEDTKINTNMKQESGDSFAATEQYISNLKNVFDQSINLYWQLMSQKEQSQDQEAKENMLLHSFQDLFGHMKNQLEDIIPSEDKSQLLLLENYSEILVSLVKSKLDSK